MNEFKWYDVNAFGMPNCPLEKNIELLAPRNAGKTFSNSFAKLLKKIKEDQMIQCPNSSTPQEYEFASKTYGSVRVTGDLVAQATERLLKIKDKLIGESPIAAAIIPVSKAGCNGLMGDIMETSNENNNGLLQMLQIIIELEKI